MKILKLILLGICSLVLVACGFGDSISHTVGGTVTGSNSPLTLTMYWKYPSSQQGSSENLTVSSPSSFIFSTKISKDQQVNITVTSSDVNQVCAITNGAEFSMGSSNKDDVSVSCSMLRVATYADQPVRYSSDRVKSVWYEDIGNGLGVNNPSVSVRNPTQILLGTGLPSFTSTDENALLNLVMLGLFSESQYVIRNTIVTGLQDTVYATYDGSVVYYVDGSTIKKISGDTYNIVETYVDASLNSPKGMVVDSTGNIYVSDTGNNLVKKINTDKVVSSINGDFNGPKGLSVDGSGNVYVADTYNSAIKKIDRNGAVSTLAGGVYGNADGVGSAARFAYPVGVATDTAGDVYVADTYNNAIKKVFAATGRVVTLAGQAGMGHLDGLASSAKFNAPTGIAVDAKGAIYVVDSANKLLRRLSF